MPPKKKSKIEKLKERLYSPKWKTFATKPRGMIYPDPHEVSSAWTPDVRPPQVEKKHRSLLGNTMFRRFFIAAIGFFLIALAFGAFSLFRGANTVSANNIDIEVLGNAFVSGGEVLPLKIQMTNRNNVALEYSDLILEYQQGSGTDEAMRNDRITVGTIPAGGMVEKLVNITLFGSQGTTRDVSITLEYRVKGSSAIFVKQKPYVVNISSTPVNVVVDGPVVTNTNQTVSFDITTSLNTAEAVRGMMIVVHYPPGFDFKSSTPEATFSNNVWSLGDLSKGSEKTITVTGVMGAQAGEERAFNIYAGTQDPSNEQKIGVQFSSQDYIVSIKKPFLDLAFQVNGNSGPEAPALPGQISQGKIDITNTLETRMTDVEITAQFSGSAFDPASVEQTGGFYDTTKQTIIWNGQTDSALKAVEPGDRHQLLFRFKPISFTNSTIKNPEIDITLSVKGRDPSQGNQFQSIADYAKKRVEYGSSLAITSNALYYSGPLQNSGPLPPTPGTPTTYTIVWSVANTTSRVTNAKARGTLPLYVDWVGSWSPQGEKVSFDSVTREVVWDIGAIDAGVGGSSSPKRLYFQVKLNPSGSQSHSSPALLSDTVLTAKDSFTGVDISRSVQPTLTRLNSDSNYNSQNDNVK